MPRLLSSQKSWLEHFRDYMADVDAPESYIWWSGVAVLAASLKRHIWYRRKKLTIYPNMYIILVGPPATGKGSVMVPSIKILKDSGGANVLSDRFSAEELIHTLSKGFNPLIQSSNGTVKLGAMDSTACLTAQEMGSIFGISDWMLDAFNQLWDVGWYDYQTRSGGAIKVNNSSLTMYTGCQPEYLKNISRSKSTTIVSSGFTSRSLFIFESKRKRVPDYWGESTIIDTSLEKLLVEDLKHIISNNSGEYIFNIDARLCLGQYQQNISIGDYESDVIRNFKNRQDTHVGKLAMVIAAASRDTRVVEKSDVELAIKYIGEIEKNLEIAFRFVGESKDVEAMARIRDFIESKGVTTQGEILATLKNHITADQLDKILYLLEVSDLFEYVNVGTKTMIKSKI